MSDRFYMICLRDSVGSNAAFWRVDGNGYSTDIDQAEVYRLEEAQRAWQHGREIDQPVCADSVDRNAVCHVDHQHIPGATVIEEGCTQYVGFQKGRWDGNDLYWLSDGALPTPDFSLATVYPSANTEAEGVIWLPFQLVDSKKRRTFPLHMLDSRRMVQGAGLRIPAHIQRLRRIAQQHKRNPPSCKTRFNCPYCGRIHWQDHPYEFEGCSNWQCGGAR